MKTFGEFMIECSQLFEGGLSRDIRDRDRGHISADRGDDESEIRKKRQGLEKDLQKKGIGYKKTVGSYKYQTDDGEGTGREVSFSVDRPKDMSKRKFGKTVRRLGRKHGQESVITKKKGRQARIHDTQSKQGKEEKSFAIGKRAKVGPHPKGDGETGEQRTRGRKLSNKKNKDRQFHYGDDD